MCSWGLARPNEHKCVFFGEPAWGLMLGKASMLLESPTTWGRSWDLLGVHGGIWIRPEEEVSGVSSISLWAGLL